MDQVTNETVTAIAGPKNKKTSSETEDCIGSVTCQPEIPGNHDKRSTGKLKASVQRQKDHVRTAGTLRQIRQQPLDRVQTHADGHSIAFN